MGVEFIGCIVRAGVAGELPGGASAAQTLASSLRGDAWAAYAVGLG